jgi:AAA15 family ATPase/GTPase
MIKKIEIENYKSIDKLSFEMGRFNVFIGENGCGKSNLLEAIAFASSADNGQLSLKGARVTEPKYFRSGFDNSKSDENIKVLFFDNEENKIEIVLKNSNSPYSNWEAVCVINNEYNIVTVSYQMKVLQYDTENVFENIKDSQIELYKSISKITKGIDFNHYILFAPENSFLRNYNIESPYTQPLGTRGEGLLKLIKVIKKEKPEEYKEIIEHLHLIDWFSDIAISDDDLAGAEFKLSDKYLEEGIGGFDIKNANEGFFLLLFYITLFVSDYTPSFFAIDNIDTALNPKLCTKLIEILAVLAKKHNKQVLITTHNPSILDGINLNDDEQRLFAVSRNKTGYTRVTRIEKKQPIEGEQSLKLSEQFLRGYIGGIPKNF